MLGKICCFTSIKNSDGKRDKSGVNMFWHNAWFLLLSCTFFCPVINLLRFCQFLSFCVKKKCSLFLLGWDFYFLSTVSKNFVFSGLAEAARVTGRALSPRHGSQPPGCPAKAALSFMGVQGSAASRCWSRDDSKARGRRKRGTRILGRLSSVLEEKRILAAQMDWGWARGKTSLRRKAPWRKDVTSWWGTAHLEFGREGASWRGRTWVTGDAGRSPGAWGGWRRRQQQQQERGKARGGQAGAGPGRQAGCRQRWDPGQLQRERRRAALSCLCFTGSLLESCPRGQQVLGQLRVDFNQCQCAGMVSRGAWILILLTLAYSLTANTCSLNCSREIHSPHL